jgi:NADP-dependent 3-hydroxy acid dehydrogenase YdfG
MRDLHLKRALVTGATGGLGRAIALALRAEGCEMVVTGRRRDALEDVAELTGGRAVAADLADRGQLETLLRDTGDIDILVANAGVPASGDLQDWTQDQIDRALEVNLASPIAVTRALLPHFRERGSGHFVYVSSLQGKVATRDASLYCATKFGLRGFAGSLRCDLYRSGIGCSVVFPGFVRDAGMFADTGASLPFGVSSVSPDQVARAVVRAIKTDRAEIDVAPVVLRAGAFIGSLSPRLSAVVQARFGAGVSAAMVQAQKTKR